MISEFINHLKVNRGYSAGTCEGYEKDLREFVKFAKHLGADKRWSTIVKEDAEAWVAEMVSRGIKPATIKRRVSALRSLYTYLRGKKMITENPIQYVSTPKRANTIPETLKNSTISETLYDPSIDLETRAMIAIMAETGIRTNEALALRTTDADMMNGTLRINGKGNKQRIVYFGEFTRSYLQNLEIRKREKLFTKSNGESRYNIHIALSKHATGDHCTPHNLRHTWASTMLNQGAGLMTVTRLMGHEHVSTTERYLKVATETLREDYEKARPRL